MKVFRFLLGLAIGAGVALLVAPKSGRELRRQLAGGGRPASGPGQDAYSRRRTHGLERSARPWPSLPWTWFRRR